MYTILFGNKKPKIASTLKEKKPNKLKRPWGYTFSIFEEAELLKEFTEV